MDTSPLIVNPLITKPVAYAGFWKGGGGGGGGGGRNQKIWEEHRSEFEIVTLKFRPIFRPKSGEEQKNKNKKKIFTQKFFPFFAQYQVISSLKPDALLAKGRGACLNFAHFSMQFCNPGDPKGGSWPMAQWPPLNTLLNEANFFINSLIR